MPLIIENMHTDDLRDERQRAQRHFWYWLCLYVEDERESEGRKADSIHAYLQMIDQELDRRVVVKHWKPWR